LWKVCFQHREKHSADWKATPADDSVQGKAIPVRDLPQTQPQAGEDARPVVLPAVPCGPRGHTRGRIAHAAALSLDVPDAAEFWEALVNGR
jgi:hypothetical protein